MPNPRRSPRVDNLALESEIQSVEGRLLDLIVQAMHDRGVSRADLARLLDVSPPRVSQLLNGEGDPTIPAVVEALYALGYTLYIEMEPMNEDGP